MGNISKQKKDLVVCDFWLLALLLPLLAIGLLMLASSSMVIADHTYGTPFHFLWHQIVYITLGLLCIFCVLKIPISFWQRIDILLLFITIFLLTLVLIPGIGHHINGSARWLGYGGVRLEASEFAKFSMVIYLASYLVRHRDLVQQQFMGSIRPLLFLAIISVLLFLEPDFGALVVLVVTAFTMLFLAGARLNQFILLAIVLIAILAVLAITSPYRVARLTAFLNPWNRPFDSGYQLTQALIAFGRGGMFGVGLGNSMQKLFYLPEAHTDFLFAVLAEEFGIVGEIIVLLMFCGLVLRILFLGKAMGKIKHYFAAYLAYGFATYFFMQIIINIGVNSGLFPTKGLTLPFISYGGSSLIINCLIIALLMRIYHEGRCQPKRSWH